MSQRQNQQPNAENDDHSSLDEGEFIRVEQVASDTPEEAEQSGQTENRTESNANWSFGTIGSGDVYNDELLKWKMAALEAKNQLLETKNEMLATKLENQELKAKLREKSLEGTLEESEQSIGKLIKEIGTLNAEFAKQTLNLEETAQLVRSVENNQSEEKTIQAIQQNMRTLGKKIDTIKKELGRIADHLAQTAFITLRTAINDDEFNATTWHSIGVLYARQNQPIDALQGFACAVQLNNKHYAAWVQLGELYEKHRQPKDALYCYKKALEARPDPDEQHLQHRVSAMEKEVTKGPTMLPPVESAWQLDIPTQVRLRLAAKQEKDGIEMDATKIG